MSPPASTLLVSVVSAVALAAALVAAPVGLLAGCQTADEHPAFVPGCEGNCPLQPGMSAPGTLPGAGTAGASSMNPDAGTGTLQGNVLLVADESFLQYSLYAADATVTADGASGSPVTAAWHGIGLDPEPFLLEGVAKVPTNWVSVKPEQVGGDALLTYQAVPTNQVTNVNGLMVSTAILDSVFTVASTLRSPDSGQVILFFRSAGTGVPMPGLHVSMPKAQVAVYASASGWVLDDGTAVTDKSGLVMFGNVQPANAGGTQTVIVTRAATGSTPAAAAGQFPVKVVQAAATIAGIDVQL